MEEQPKPKNTQQGIPLVTPNIADILARDLVSENTISNRDLISRIDEENPVITKYILGTLSNLERGGASRHIVQEAIFGMLNVYELIRRQGDANKLEEMYNGDSPE